VIKEKKIKKGKSTRRLARRIKGGKKKKGVELPTGSAECASAEENKSAPSQSAFARAAASARGNLEESQNREEKGIKTPPGEGILPPKLYIPQGEKKTEKTKTEVDSVKIKKNKENSNKIGGDIKV